MRTWVLSHNNRLLTQVRMPEDATEDEVRSKALSNLEKHPGVFCAGTDMVPFEFGKCIRWSSVVLAPEA